MTRHPDDYTARARPSSATSRTTTASTAALAGADVAVYLVHSLGDNDFEQQGRRRGASPSATPPRRPGVQQIVYLGGLGSDGDDLSAHLRSRREVETLLGEGGVPVTVLRAAIVVGAGGISWELTRQLVKNLPAMVVPKWAATRTQPIGIDDAVRYLVGVDRQPRGQGPGASRSAAPTS